MISWIVRGLLAGGGVVAGWFVAEDAPNFGVVQMMMALILLTFVVAVLAFWPALGFGSGCIGGAIFKGLDFPLPWMLGSLTAAAIIAVAGLDWKLPSAARNAARPIIGVMAGSAFTAEVARPMVEWWEAILPLVSFLVLITLAGRAFFTRFCGFDKTTAYFASTPGD